ncbi:unnamed protein product [Calypogeia fissa]
MFDRIKLFLLVKLKDCDKVHRDCENIKMFTIQLIELPPSITFCLVGKSCTAIPFLTSFRKNASGRFPLL